MKRFFIIACALLALAACKKEPTSPQPTPAANAATQSPAYNATGGVSHKPPKPVPITKAVK